MPPSCSGWPPSSTTLAVCPYHRPVIRPASERSASTGSAATSEGATVAGAVRLGPLPEVAASRPSDVAEAFRDLPGLALLESARPGRNARWSYLTADPVALLTEAAAGDDPFADARILLARLHAGGPESLDTETPPPPFLGGLLGYLGYELGDL